MTTKFENEDFWVQTSKRTGKREIFAEEKGCRLHHVTLSPRDDQLVYHHDRGQRKSQRVGWGAASHEISMRSANGIAVGESVVFMHEKNSGVKTATLLA